MTPPPWKPIVQPDFGCWRPIRPGQLRFERDRRVEIIHFGIECTREDYLAALLHSRWSLFGITGLQLNDVMNFVAAFTGSGKAGRCRNLPFIRRWGPHHDMFTIRLRIS